jgi:hypothetical protein
MLTLDIVTGLAASFEMVMNAKRLTRSFPFP